MDRRDRISVVLVALFAAWTWVEMSALRHRFNAVQADAETWRREADRSYRTMQLIQGHTAGVRTIDPTTDVIPPQRVPTTPGD